MNLFNSYEKILISLEYFFSKNNTMKQLNLNSLLKYHNFLAFTTPSVLN
jgi:BarA-like signal transduction histidine kinase